jgi:hypothetical protein
LRPRYWRRITRRPAHRATTLERTGKSLQLTTTAGVIVAAIGTVTVITTIVATALPARSRHPHFCEVIKMTL